MATCKKLETRNGRRKRLIERTRGVYYGSSLKLEAVGEHLKARVVMCDFGDGSVCDDRQFEVFRVSSKVLNHLEFAWIMIWIARESQTFKGAVTCW